MSGPEVARLDASRVDPSLRKHLLWTLVFRDELDAVERFLSTVPWDIEWDDNLLDAMDQAAEMGDRDRVRRLMALRGEHRQDYEPCLAAKLLALDSERGPMLELIEEQALAHVDDPVEFAYQMLTSSPALGILVARGVCLAPAGLLEAETLLDRLLEVRDRLGLSPDDPVEPLVEKRLEGPDEDLDDDEAVSELVLELATKASMVDEMRSELAETRDRLARLAEKEHGSRDLQDDEPELARVDDHPAIDTTDAMSPPEGPGSSTDATAPHGSPAGAGPLQEHVLHERAPASPDTARLRGRIKELEAMIRERGAERRELRQEIASMRAMLSVERTVDPEPPENDWEHIEQSAAPVRVPVYTDRFLDGLQELPLTARRAAMKVVGLAAAGDPSAMRNMLRLKRNPTYARLRAGPYRVIVEPRTDDLCIVDVVHRKDLAQRIASL